MPNRSLYCPKCQKHTHLRPLNGGSYIGVGDGRIVYVSKCNVCNRIFIITQKRIAGQYFDEEILPKDLPKPIDEDTPDFLKSDLRETYDCFSVQAYRAAGAMARRCLEFCCKEKGAEGENLKEKIGWLLEERIITQDLKLFADEVRLTGNDALHSEDVITKEDAADILKLLEDFIDFLFIKPAIAQQRRAKREQALASKSQAH